jgi:hypothetical protein
MGFRLLMLVIVYLICNGGVFFRKKLHGVDFAVRKRLPAYLAASVICYLEFTPQEYVWAIPLCITSALVGCIHAVLLVGGRPRFVHGIWCTQCNCKRNTVGKFCPQCCRIIQAEDRKIFLTEYVWRTLLFIFVGGMYVSLPADRVSAPIIAGGMEN